MNKREKKAHDQRVTRIAQRATSDNPINIMKLDALCKAVESAVLAGASDAEAEAAGREFIASLGGN